MSVVEMQLMYLNSARALVAQAKHTLRVRLYLSVFRLLRNDHGSDMTDTAHIYIYIYIYIYTYIYIRSAGGEMRANLSAGTWSNQGVQLELRRDVRRGM